jgi:Subtilisin inhibitor-like
MRLRNLLLLLLIPTLTGCEIGQEQGTELTIRASNERAGRAEFHLSCDPPGGDLPNPARACAALSEEPGLVTRPEPIECRVQYCPWGVTIEGSLDGKSIDVDLITGLPVEDLGIYGILGRLGISWELLQKHVTRRRVEIRPETRRVFEPGELEVADLVTCDIRGHHLEASVLSHSGSPVTVGYGGTNNMVTMTVQTREDGSVAADCHTK